MTNHVKQQLRGALIEQPQRWAAAVLLLAVAALVAPAYQWLKAERGQVGSVGRAIDRQGAETRVWMHDNLVPPVNRLTDAAAGIPGVVAGEFRRQADAARVEVLGPDGRFVDLQRAVLARVDGGLSIIQELRRDDLRPLLSAATGTVAEIGRTARTYDALPAQLGAQLRPSFLALEPEITCRHADGTGYGGCWHSRVTGLFGEAEKVGGVFTQKFPSLADSWVGISKDTHGFFDKYVQPRPMHTGDYFKAAGKITLGLGAAGLRCGVF